MSRQLFKIFLHRVSLRAILATREGSIFELNITFRKPRKRKTTFPRTPGVAIRVLDISSIRTSPVASPGLRAILATRKGPIFKLDIPFRKPRKRKTTFPRTPGVAQRVLDISSIRTSLVASLTLTGIHATKENPTFKLRIAFRNPRKTNFPRTTGVASRVIDTSNIRTSRVASLTLTGIRVTKEKPMFNLRIAFRNPRKTTFPRTPGVARCVIDTFVICTLFRAKASARIASSCRVPLRAVG